MFVWDGTSCMGNEYWEGMLSASEDPAAACCLLIPEVKNTSLQVMTTCHFPHLLNPAINPKLRGITTIVASPSRGLIPLGDVI